MSKLYTFCIKIYGAAIRIAALRSTKARKWLNGRKDLIERLERALDKDKSYIWFHVASLGEFEQGRPLIEKIRQQHPALGIVLTFFSPSGFEVRKDFHHVDVVTYLPLDTPSQARNFIKVLNPALAVFVKYELWYHHLSELEKRNIPTLLISAQLRSGQFYFRQIGAFLEKRLRHLQQIFVTNRISSEFLIARGYTNVRECGDTRIDRVLQIADRPVDWHHLVSNGDERTVLVAGSTWPRDERMIREATSTSSTKLILAPHETHEERIRALLDQFGPNSCRLSQWTATNAHCDAIIVDTIGDLAHLYSIADVTYVGGGFDSGIHNILEPVAHNKPVCIGPRYRRFEEAHALISEGIVHSIKTSDELKSVLAAFRQDEHQQSVHQRARMYMDAHRGATDNIYDYIREQRLI